MTDVIHQGYGDILQQARREGFGGGGNRSGIYFPNKRADMREGRKILIPLLLAVTILAGAFSTALYTRGTVSQPDVVMRKEIPNRDDNAQVVESLKSEIEIMKRILSGLVASMETIARDKKEVIVSEQKAKFPYPVQVTSDKAHLREGPHRGASSLTTVEKNTVLLVIAAQDEWLKVFTPKGEEAWISADIVSERRE